jgi:hypothetical protein
MAELILGYRRGRQRRGIARHGRLVLDLAACGPAYVVAELELGEGRPQIAAVLLGEGRYLERARAGEQRRAAPPRPRKSTRAPSRPPKPHERGQR